MAAVWGIVLSAGLSAAEPVRRGYENWMAVIEEDGARYCGPRGYLFSNRKVPDFQLRVIRETERYPCRIALVSAFRFVDPGRRIDARVDGGPGLGIGDAMESKKEGGLRIYTVTDAKTAKILLRRIRAGAWIRFDYYDLLGQRSSAVFSLMGASAALDAIDCRRIE
jgi:hypothetical protein